MPYPIVRPDLVENKYIEYLDKLNEYGKDLFEMRLYLADEFIMSAEQAEQIAEYWCKLRESAN